MHHRRRGLCLLQQQQRRLHQIVDPWKVQGEVVQGKVQAINYERIIQEFGSKPIDQELLQRFARVTGVEPHPFLKRGIFFSHRDLDKILTLYEQKKPFYLYTGRGPSSGSMHVGHMVPFIFCKQVARNDIYNRWLQQVMDVKLVVQLTDDEKFLFNPKLTLEESNKYAIENAKDIIAFGFNPKKTFIFSNLNYMNGAFYKNVVRISKTITGSMAKNVFGFTDSDSVGKLGFAAVQAAPSFSSTFPHLFGTKNIPCLIPCAIDQDPYFRLTRHCATRLKYPLPALVHSVFFPALQGHGTKMSASDPNSAIYLSDSSSQIQNKIKRHAVSGGGATAELHRRHGGNIHVDISYQYLKFFLEDDAELERIAKAYTQGELSTGELKTMCAKVMSGIVENVQEQRKLIDETMINRFMQV